MGAAVGGARGGKRGGIVAINITPMVDVMLVLLVIMMVSAQYIVSQSLKVELPKSASSDDSVSMTAVVTITQDGAFYFNQEPVAGDSDLVRRMQEVKRADKDVNLVVTADAEARHGKIVHVIDLAKQNDISKFAINVQREK
jgi:biopolymer transport protein ExbD